MPAQRSRRQSSAPGPDATRPARANGKDKLVDPEDDRDGTVGSIPFATASEAPTRKTFAVSGYELTPTIGYNVFWWFVAERHGIEQRRRSGAQGPWTTNAYLAGPMYACNTFRVLDKACQFLIRDVIEAPRYSQEPRELLFRILLFNAFTSIPTWKRLEDNIGLLTWAHYDRKKYQAVLDDARRDKIVLFTQAFQKQAGGAGAKGHTTQLNWLEIMMKDDNLLLLLQTEGVYVEDVYDYLRTYRGIAEFNAYQLVLNIGYSSLLVASSQDFVAAGLGASSGLLKLFGESMVQAKADYPGIESDTIRWMEANQEAELARLGIPFTGIDRHHRRMELADLEHAICEVDKFLRLSHPRLRGTKPNGKVKRQFHGRTRVMEPMVLPKVWKERKKMPVRIRQPVNKEEEQWEVERIVGRKEMDGEMKCYVFWKGFEEKDMTWEPERNLMRDVPDLMKDFLLANNHTMVEACL